MAYQPISVPTGAPSDIVRLVQGQIDPVLRDVHAMLRLPIKDIEGLDAECALSPTLVLCSLIDGVAKNLLNSVGGVGDRFTAALDRHFPWSQEPNVSSALTGSTAVELIYRGYRDALTHNLGAYRYGQPQQFGAVKLLKGPLSELEIESIEKASSRPTEWDTHPTLQNDGTELRLIVKAFYWGVRQAAESIVRSATQTTLQSRQQIPMSVTASARPFSPIIRRDST